jgi:acyl-coenzyme A thioesterase PaaI-like protein
VWIIDVSSEAEVAASRIEKPRITAEEFRAGGALRRPAGLRDPELRGGFLTRPAPVDVLAAGRILKLGRRLAVGEVVMRSKSDPQPVCQVTGTYALPPDPG